MSQSNILVVDDDPRNLEAIEAILRPLGKTLVTAKSGKAALRQCLETDFAVIILDVTMPSLDGFQTAEIIRSRERSQATPIIFLTASDRSDLTVERGYETGAVDYLTKPPSPHVLRSRVAVFVELHERAKELQAQERQVRELEAHEHKRQAEETERRERERADQAIRQILDRQAIILRSVPIVVYTAEMSAPCRMTWISDNVEAVTGYDADVFLTKPGFWTTRVAPEDLEQVRRALAATGDRGRHSCQCRWQRQDGTWRWFLSQFMVSPQSSAGDQAELTGTTLDITEHHQAQEALAEAERRFHQAQKMEAVGRLAGGVAHDFNNLLSVVLGYGQFVLEALAPDDPSRADVQQIMEVGNRAAALTRQLLTFSRQQVFASHVLDLNRTVEGVQGLLRPLIGEDIELVVAARAVPACVMADEGQIEQAIMNLAVNARDAMPTGGRLCLETDTLTTGDRLTGVLPELPPGSYVSLSVADTGCGMDEETLARIFEPFFTTKEAGKGTGLGLATVYGIVRQSGGQIRVESAVGCGTTFRIYLPVATDDARPGGEAPSSKATRTGSETVLYAEDEPNLREIVRSALSRLGYTVLVAEDGQAALQLAGRHEGPIDLLVTDVVMPRMNGRELAVRLGESRSGLKVLYLSGYTDRGITEADLALPGRALFQKPFAPDALAQRVRQLLDEPARGAATGSSRATTSGSKARGRKR